MSGTTNVDQNEFEFHLLQFLDKDKHLTVEEKQSKDVAIKIRKYLKDNGELKLPVKSNRDLFRDNDDTIR